MRQLELVSVIIPVYNSEKYLKKCVESIIGQTYSLLDIILIDDGSEDRSLQICEELEKRDKRIRVYHHDNMGVSATRNRGIELVKGSHIMFVDSDDVVEKDMIENMIKEQKCRYLPLCCLASFSGEEPELSLEIEFEKKEIKKDEFWDMFDKGLIHSPCNKLYDADIVKKNVRFENNISLGEDLLFNIKYLEQIDGFVFIDKVFYHYRNTGNQSLSHKYYPDGFQIQVYLYEKLIAFCRTQIKMNEESWAKLYWSFFKALQNSIDAEYEFNNCVATEAVLEKMQNEEFLKTFQKVYLYRKQYKPISRLEIFLYMKGMWQIDYRLRMIRRK